MNKANYNLCAQVLCENKFPSQMPKYLRMIVGLYNKTMFSFIPPNCF